MGVSGAVYDTAMVESVLFRSAGTRLAGMVYGPALPPSMRSFTTKGKGLGHAYLHLAGPDPVGNVSGPSHKSRFQDHATMVAVLVEILATTGGRAALQWLDANPTVANGIWLHGGTALPLSNPWYGYEQGGATLKKIRTAALNMRAHGYALFITSAYPDGFHAGLNPLAPPFVPGMAL